MPVKVQVPIRVVVDPHGLMSRLDDLGQAVESATTRALLRSVDVLVERRGGWVAHETASPVLTWNGEGLSDVAVTTRRLAEEAVRRAIAAAVAAGLPGDDAGDAGLARRLVDDPAEALDPDRLAAAAGLYTIPGYEDGEPTIVVFDEPFDVHNDDVRLQWEPVSPGPAMSERFRAELQIRYGTRVPAQVGVIFQGDDGQLWVYVERVATGEVLLDGALGPLLVRELRTSAGDVVAIDTPFVPSAGSTYQLRYLGRGNTDAERLQAFLIFYGPALAEHVRADLPTGVENADALVAARVEETARRWATTGVPADTRTFLVLVVDGRPFLLQGTVDVAADLDAELVPIVTLVDAPRTEDEPGTGERGLAGDEGAGRERSGEGRSDEQRGGEGDAGDQVETGGPLGTTASDVDRVWPIASLTGDVLACTPFLGEPAAADLVDDGGLLDRMGRLAAALEVPECGYLGRFAINAAEVVAARARAVGVAAAQASTTNDVTIRHDGRGNNGFLDVRPGASPEFEYLRLLGGLAAQVHDFGSAVADIYLLPANRHLVRVNEGGSPNVSGWILRFLSEFPDAVQAGYMHLYAETCRVLLLQQLRTSRAGILGRCARLDETATAFAQTLDILGESLVQLSTLRAALRHSAEVHVVGTVRQVLSVPETVPDPEGASVALPPPIDDVPARILAVVGDATVQRRGDERVVLHRGRTWTLAELDAAVGVRRQLINQVDPLFLQVENLEWQYAAMQRDPAAPRRFLEQLLGRMAEANKSMLDEASDPDDGAFFALEASQYVQREGGRDWRGLRYDLQGVHALADEQLRPAIGHDVLYVAGINDAIGRKAAFDQFLAVFATGGIILLGLLCAPLGAVVVAAVTGIAGLALTAHDVLEARRQSTLYRALEDPELFLRWQEVQLAQLMAGLGVAFSVFDVVGVGRAAHVLVDAARYGLRVAERASVGLAARSLARSARREIVRNMTREVLENAVRQAVTEAAITAALDRLLPAVITPVLVPWLREVAREHGTLGEVDAALGELVPRSTP
ncbi:hypothetical protein [Actinomycetospora straminea]|uniref:Uncharacterized protein n=1 Tax=Actinomycetospora straminea TaxID=663607 RepID=A0ABP9EIK6_9PSEU|nr:hypothetical protein [Actinomycetospora straminea]MDD7933731.1 hypothetical protein [Actinomycetospora straminea]